MGAPRRELNENEREIFGDAGGDGVTEGGAELNGVDDDELDNRDRSKLKLVRESKIDVSTAVADSREGLRTVSSSVS